ncbi:cytochrome P450 [Nocardia sp. NPDC049220]|uniref:cytochrome P450 n=1 Tax=Nocardia sp. NPDC049220 TaxID=3155273 RepID=UPI0033F5BE5F
MVGSRFSESLLRFDPHDEGLLDDPYKVYARYRRQDPVHWGLPYSPGGSGCWYLFRHDHVLSVLRDRRFRRRQAPGTRKPDVRVPEEHRGFVELSGRLLLSTDPPDHRRLRSVLAPAFTPIAAESYRAVAVEAADRLIDTLGGLSDFDVIDDYAAPVSMAVICAVLGVAEAEVDSRLPGWIAGFGNGFDLRKQSEMMAQAGAAAAELLRYFDTVIAGHDPARPGLLSVLIAAHEAGRVTREELSVLCVQVVFAAHGTTVAQIGNMVGDLLARPDQLALLRARPELIAGAVNESVRFNGSVQSAAARKPTDDVAVGDTLIRAGQPVIGFVGAANRDPAVFVDPDRFDITRDTTAAIGFGGGIHHCLGAPLARLECEIAVGTLVHRLPGLAVGADHLPQRQANTVLSGLRHLKVVTG